MKIKGIHIVLLMVICSITFNTSNAQIYLHDFGTTTISTHPYTAVPTTFDANLNTSSWSNSTSAWTSFAGSSGQAIALNNSGGTPTITLTFNIGVGYEVSVSSFDFWRQRSASGAQNWSMTINGISVGSGTAPTTGAAIGVTTVGSPVNNQTGTITVILSLSGASGTGTFRLDDFTLNGTVTPTCTPPATPSSPTAVANPSCGATSLNIMAPAAGETWYWQGLSSSGTSTANPTSATFPVSATGTYYARARDNTTFCWSTASSSIAMTINSSPSISLQPSNQSVTAGSNGTFSVTASGGGLTYQWQEDQGGGFVNIINGGIYSGATTATLTLTGVTAPMDTWQYRVIVSGACAPPITSTAATLSIVLTGVGDYRSIANGNWGTNTTWEKWNGSAWVACLVGDFPNLGTANVEIRTHTVDLDGSGSPPFDCKNLLIQTGGLLWTNHFTGVNGYLQIYGNITSNGTVGLSTGDDICFDITGGINCLISGTGSFYATRIRKDGSINATSNTTLTIDINIFLFWSSASGTVLYNDGTNSLFDVIVNSGKTLKGVTAGAVSNNMSMDGVAGLDATACGGSYTIYGTIEVDGTVYATTNNVNLARPISITIKNGGILKCAYITTSASGVSTSTLTIESGGKLTLTGADGSSNTFSSFSTTNNIYNLNSGSTVEFTGTVAQNVESQLTYSNITFNGSGLKTLNGLTNVTGIATFTNGLVASTAVNLFNMSSSSSATGANNLSFVRGPVAKTGNTNFTFPVGKDAQYRPISATALTGSETFTAEYFHADPNAVPYDVTLKDATLDDIGRCEYWILNRAGSVNAYVTLSWDTYSCGVTSLPDLAVARWDGTMWKDHGNGATTGTTASGTIISSGLVTSFSPFTLASKVSGVNPLPIDLLSFTANYNNKNAVDVKWSTATETNNDFFTVERSRDASNFEAINITDGVGNSTHTINYSMVDETPLDGVSYYRLKQTDFDGTPEYSSIVAVQANEATFEIISTITCASQNDLEITYSCAGNCEVNFDLYDVTGKKIFSIMQSASEKNSKLIIPTSNLTPGIYLLKANNGNKIISKKIRF